MKPPSAIGVPDGRFHCQTMTSLSPSKRTPPPLVKSRAMVEGHEMVTRWAAALLCAVLLPLCAPAAHAESGIASIYAYQSGKTANGERASATALTAAHRTLPFGTRVRVTNKRNGKSVVVRINDRGPFIKGRVIDVTPAAAKVLGFSGLTKVSLERVDGLAAK
jgi:rare lipoprotein A